MSLAKFSLNKFINLKNLSRNFNSIRQLTTIESDEKADYDFFNNFKTLKIERQLPYVTNVQLNRHEKSNAMDLTMFKEIGLCFRLLNEDPSTRVIILSGNGKHFTTGLDLNAFQALFAEQQQDASRNALFIRRFVGSIQSSMLAVGKCQKPVISTVHSACVGGGVDLISATDIRYATADAWFQVKEVDIGIAADIGTLQYFPRICASQSLVRELVYTARKMLAQEAFNSGFISAKFDTAEQMRTAALELATKIAAKSPIAVQGSKVNLDYSRDHTIDDGLKFSLHWAMSMLQSEDIPKAVMSTVSKSDAPDFQDV